MSKTKFIGDAGEHYVAYMLAYSDFNVGLTTGNMPDIDLFVSKGDATKSITIQVKSAAGAYRRKRYGTEGYEWDVSKRVIGKHSLNFWYIFVDFKWRNGNPDIYIIPSYWVAEFVKQNFTRYLFFIPKVAIEKYHLENHQGLKILESIFNEENPDLNWAKEWDEEVLVRWGVE